MPVWPWSIALIAAWVLVGLVGHDPWKADEAHTFGIVVDFLQHRDWVVPTLAGEPFMEKPPLFYIVSAGSAYLFGGLLPLHDAARLATDFFVGIALLFLGLTARELYGRGYAPATPLLSSVALAPFCDSSDGDRCRLLAGFALGVYVLALAPRTFWSASAAMSTGATIAFLAKGLLGPGLLGLAALLLPIFASWRTRRYRAVLGVAVIGAAIPAAVWMGALYARSPDLFREWLVTNLGRFLGFTRIGPHTPPGFYAYSCYEFAPHSRKCVPKR